MNRKITAFLTALSVIAGVCAPVYAEGSTEPEYMELVYDEAYADTAEEPSDAAGEISAEEDTPGSEDDIPDETADNTEDTQADEPVQDDRSEASGDLIAVERKYEDRSETTTEYVTELPVSETDLNSDEAEYLAVSWADWDASTGVLTLKGQLPDTYWDEANHDDYNIARLAGIKPSSVKKVIITKGTKLGTSTDQMFRGFENCDEIRGLEYFDTSRVTDMTSMFLGCDSLRTIRIPSTWDTRSNKKTGGMFNGCDNLESLDLTYLDTSNVDDMDHMFGHDFMLKTVRVSDRWKTSAVTTSNLMFEDCYSLVGGAGTEFNKDHVDYEYARIDRGTSAPGYFTASGAAAGSSVPKPTVEIKPVFGGRTITFNYSDSSAEIYYNFGSSDITTSCSHVKAGQTVFVKEALWGTKAAMYFKEYKNGQWSDVAKWGVLNVQLDKPIIVQSGKKSDNKVKIYTQAKDSYIIYTTDSTIPSINEGTNKLTVKNGTIIWGTSGVITVPKGGTVRAIAVRCGLVTSYVATYYNVY